jgi:peptidoglycan hydrolase-like protein with peptidoglycan-binding domain
MTLCLVATTLSGAPATSTRKKHHSSHSSGHSSSHSYSARRNVPAAPTPERYQEIQQALASRGYYKGTVNGSWDPDSVDALKRFQTDQNLPPDGKLTPLSLIAMGLGPRRSTSPSGQPAGSLSAPPSVSVAPVAVQPNPAVAPQDPAGAH